jgi:hypothetical protein
VFKFSVHHPGTVTQSLFGFAVDDDDVVVVGVAVVVVVVVGAGGIITADPNRLQSGAIVVVELVDTGGWQPGQYNVVVDVVV